MLDPTYAHSITRRPALRFIASILMTVLLACTSGRTSSSTPAKTPTGGAATPSEPATSTDASAVTPEGAAVARRAEVIAESAYEGRTRDLGKTSPAPPAGSSSGPIKRRGTAVASPSLASAPSVVGNVTPTPVIDNVPRVGGSATGTSIAGGGPVIAAPLAPRSGTSISTNATPAPLTSPGGAAPGTVPVANTGMTAPAATGTAAVGTTTRLGPGATTASPGGVSGGPVTQAGPGNIAAGPGRTSTPIAPATSGTTTNVVANTAPTITSTTPRVSSTGSVAPSPSGGGGGISGGTAGVSVSPQIAGATEVIPSGGVTGTGITTVPGQNPVVSNSGSVSVQPTSSATVAGTTRGTSQAATEAPSAAVDTRTVTAPAPNTTATPRSTAPKPKSPPSRGSAKSPASKPVVVEGSTITNIPKDSNTPAGARPSPGVTPQQSRLNKILNGWSKEQQTVARELVSRHGLPDEVSETRLVWINAGPFRRIELSGGVSPDPGVSHTIEYRVAAGRLAELKEFNPLITYNPERRELRVRGERPELNVLALNLANEILMGRQTAKGASVLFAQGASAGNKMSETLMFDPRRR